ncbi:MAG TPA: hypothetical protein VH575_12415 [Gemmataceae bacterium]
MEQSSAMGSPLRVVVVEDDATVRLSLKETLEKKLGHQVIGEAATGTDMVRTVRLESPT